MAEVFSRRGFVRGSILASVASATGAVAWTKDFFCSAAGGEAVVALVLDALQLQSNQKFVVEKFVHSLQKGVIEQTESEDFVNALIASAKHSEDVLVRYVVGEFVARTNYYEYISGIDSKLQILDVNLEDRRVS